jgi:hypothetical protein
MEKQNENCPQNTPTLLPLPWYTFSNQEYPNSLLSFYQKWGGNVEFKLNPMRQCPLVASAIILYINLTGYFYEAKFTQFKGPST